ncbi:MAG TPA: ATP-binding protein [Candidatus Acidoferrales bacterium]|nr:ATP-binding protein [Candidatus Acidoferrales bacterium]
MSIFRGLILLPSETEWVEFKLNDYRPEGIGEYISALSNAAALHSKKFAFIVWGVQDQTHKIMGTSFKPRKEKVGNEELENWLAHNLNPRINFTIHEFECEMRRIVLFEIPACNYAPVRWKDTEYIRVGTYTKKLKDHVEKERALWSRLSGTSFETGVARADLVAEEVLAVLDYPTYFEMTGQRVPTTKSAILDRLDRDHIIEHTGRGRWDITNLGALLFARKLSDFGALNRKAVRVIVYKGGDRTTTVKERVNSKGYAAGFEDLLDYINDQLPRSEEIQAALRRDVRIYPEIAIRELVANATIHQDLWLRGSSATVEIFSDRIEITNPGRPLIDTLRFIDEPPQSRNEALAAFMRRLNICEERGSGIDKVISEIELYQLPPPMFQATEHHTTAILFAPRKLAAMEWEDKVRACYQHACLRFVCREVMTNASLRARFGIDETNAAIASRIIARTIKAGFVRAKDPTSSSRKHTAYVPFWA